MSGEAAVVLRLEESEILAKQAATVFQPRTPISVRELFAGRWTELNSVSDAVCQSGLHAVIYGERGVGKTSLSNVIKPTIVVLDGDETPARLIIKCIASSGDTFSSIWIKLLREVSLVTIVRQLVWLPKRRAAFRSYRRMEWIGRSFQ